ncbi:hypothetical protein FHG87_016999 [Trinorchestia longiramus]|nr:hypothetical protein FHG87_016999 [Trinorchestia longiramus]
MPYFQLRKPCRQRDSNPGLPARKHIHSPVDQAAAASAIGQTTTVHTQCTSSGEGDRGDPALQTTRLRQEIAALREARDALVAYRQRLNKKIQKGMHRQSRRWEAERRFMEVDEAVEAVDSSIETSSTCFFSPECAQLSSALLRRQLLASKQVNSFQRHSQAVAKP